MTARECGTLARYVVDKCPCDACREANRVYEARRSRLIAYGQWRPYVDAEPVRQHVQLLSEFGIGWKRAAQLAGVPNGSVSKLLYGGPGDRPPSRGVRSETAARLLGVTPTLDLLGATVPVDAAGTRRRLQALVAIGWPQAQLAARLGMDPSNFGKTMQAPRVIAKTARAVRVLYDELWDQPPPETTSHERGAAARARNHAAAREWLVPAYWDDDLIDVPDDQLDAELDRRVSLMDDAELRRCLSAVDHERDRSPLTRAGAKECRRRRRYSRSVMEVAS
ncbi:hypothetical protein C1I98_11090 [Spongiactinospora gelatinilytica]|uniref:Uncharacterized protein n=1 Tax=Spongiactinospora gelatinilytica TaxID=2666298 RepID=A0A2W2GQ21_9ACTN|nr:hypothetical protein [Spongiactinospora gelatinilytica]PZG49853.1 hypothetical protein C1I98_11090 [Spongiactinospora gelatinilytica]